MIVRNAERTLWLCAGAGEKISFQFLNQKCANKVTNEIDLLLLMSAATLPPNQPSNILANFICVFNVSFVRNFAVNVVETDVAVNRSLLWFC